MIIKYNDPINWKLALTQNTFLEVLGASELFLKDPLKVIGWVVVTSSFRDSLLVQLQDLGFGNGPRLVIMMDHFRFRVTSWPPCPGSQPRPASSSCSPSQRPASATDGSCEAGTRETATTTTITTTAATTTTVRRLLEGQVVW